MWSSTGTRSPKTSFWNHAQAGGLSTSPAHTTRSTESRPNRLAGSVPYRISRRTAVGEVKTPLTLSSATVR
jgi:hypothetical protein